MVGRRQGNHAERFRFNVLSAEPPKRQASLRTEGLLNLRFTKYPFADEVIADSLAAFNFRQGLLDVSLLDLTHCNEDLTKTPLVSRQSFPAWIGIFGLAPNQGLLADSRRHELSHSSNHRAGVDHV